MASLAVKPPIPLSLMVTKNDLSAMQGKRNKRKMASEMLIDSNVRSANVP